MFKTENPPVYPGNPDQTARTYQQCYELCKTLIIRDLWVDPFPCPAELIPYTTGFTGFFY
jgi:hypothetical protein